MNLPCPRWKYLSLLAVLLLVAAGARTADGQEVVAPFTANEEIRRLGRELRRGAGDTRRRVEAIVDTIFSEEKGLGFHYRRRPTLTAAEALESREGNCLSLVNLFVSLARSAGIPAVYLRVEDFESYYRHQGTVVQSNHVIGGVSIGTVLLHIDFLPDRPKRYRSLQEISDAEATALYFNAVASEALFEGDLEGARRLFDEALAVRPELAETWNNLSILHKRHGDLDAAVESLQEALRLDPKLLPALQNLSGLYRLQGRAQDEEALEKRILALRTRNPFFLVQQALLKLEDEELEEAFDLARRARRIEPDLPDSYLVMGRVELRRGKREAAERHFEGARKKSAELSSRFESELQRKINRLLSDEPPR